MNPKDFFEYLQSQGISFFAGVPDSLLKEICACITANVSPRQHIICANEGGAVALGIGYHLATGKIPLIYLQIILDSNLETSKHIVEKSIEDAKQHNRPHAIVVRKNTFGPRAPFCVT